MRRVAITGAGTVNPLGQTVAATYEALRQGRCAIWPLAFRDVDRLTVRIGAQVTGWQPDLPRAGLAMMDPFSQYAVVAARQAVQQSGLRFDGALGETTNLVSEGSSNTRLSTPFCSSTSNPSASASGSSAWRAAFKASSLLTRNSCSDSDIWPY